MAILGSTGSIGRQTLDIIRRHPDHLQVAALTANSNGDALKAQGAEFGCRSLALMSERAGREAGIPGGMRAVVDCATLHDADVVVVAVAGVIGLEPTLAAIEAGRDIALASKEVLVAAGEAVMPRVRAKGIKLTPIDSEHSAVFQCLEGSRPDQVQGIMLTASGGPFRGWTADRLRSVTRQDALNHPTWSMGGKITIDSATLMNKGLEVIEARWLFDLPIDRIDVVVHPQSIIHSMVRFKDGSVLAQLGRPDMRIPIQYALLHPERVENGLAPWDPVESGPLTFERPDSETFRCLELARVAGREGRTVPTVLNAANEAAVQAFLNGRCGFLQIAEIVEACMAAHRPAEPTLDAIFDADRWARVQVETILGGR